MWNFVSQGTKIILRIMDTLGCPSFLKIALLGYNLHAINFICGANNLYSIKYISSVQLSVFSSFAVIGSASTVIPHPHPQLLATVYLFL